jgi:hypothetical protein
MSRDLKRFEAVFAAWEGLECRIVTLAFHIEHDSTTKFEQLFESGNAMATRMHVCGPKLMQTTTKIKAHKNGQCRNLCALAPTYTNQCKTLNSPFHGGNTGSNPVRVTTYNFAN